MRFWALFQVDWISRAGAAHTGNRNIAKHLACIYFPRSRTRAAPVSRRMKRNCGCRWSTGESFELANNEKFSAADLCNWCFFIYFQFFLYWMKTLGEYIQHSRFVRYIQKIKSVKFYCVFLPFVYIYRYVSLSISRFRSLSAAVSCSILLILVTVKVSWLGLFLLWVFHIINLLNAYY